MTDNDYMELAFEEARKAANIDEVPIGAIVVDSRGRVIGRGFNSPISSIDPTAHAEINAIRSASEYLKNYRLVGTTLFVTMEPCVMCMGAIIHARIRRVVFGAQDLKWGAVSSLYNMADDQRFNHQPVITAGVGEEAAKKIIQDFFKNKRS